MKLIKAAAIAAMGLSVSGCATIETATRNAPFEAMKETHAITQLIEVSDVKVNVSRELRVSEADLYYPVADIVWHGEERGDRYQQVGAIFEQSAKAATVDLKEGSKANVEIEVLRFHGVTDKARYTVGGVHSINFRMHVRDAETGVDLIEPREIKADLKAYGGQDAIKADSNGLTQKKRITAHLTKVIHDELSGGVSVAAAVAPEAAAPTDVVTRSAQTVAQPKLKPLKLAKDGSVVGGVY